jgi:hypothetical protein
MSQQPQQQTGPSRMNFTPKSAVAAPAVAAPPSATGTFTSAALPVRRSMADLERLRRERDALQQKISKYVSHGCVFLRLLLGFCMRQWTL